MNQTQAAFSQTDITPDFQVELIGCHRKDNRSKGVLHPLYAQALLLKQNDETFCLITLDLIGLTTQLAEDLRRKVSNLLNTQIEHVMLNFSHTHSGPDSASSALNGERYFNYLCQQILKCVEEAKTNYKPCSAGWALTEAGVGENRRDDCTAYDNRLGALKIVEASNRKAIAMVLRMTAHANVLMDDSSLISGDFFSVARERLQDYFSCPVMFVQGAAGNVKPFGTDKIRGGVYSDIEKIVDILLSAVKGLHFELHDIKDVQMVSKRFDYVSDVPSEEEANRIADEALKECGIDGTKWLKECKRLREEGVSVITQQGELQLFKINNGCFCGVPEEIFCELSLEVKEKTGNSLVFFNGYTNGCTGYIPNRAEWKKGGYETLYSILVYYRYNGRVMPYQEDTADQLMELVTNAWHEMTFTKKIKR